VARPNHTPAPEPASGPSLADAEVAAAVVAMTDAGTHQAVAARLRRRFGIDRAWPVAMVRAFTLAHGPHGLRGKPGQRGKVEGNATLRSFVDGLIGRVALDELERRVQARFGDAAPTRSSLHRYAQRERQRLATMETRR
jgi:hypothetical protein